MSRRYDRDRAARILADAMLLGDSDASRRWDISTRTIDRYRLRMKTDAILSDLVRELSAKKDEGWIKDVPSAIAEGIAFLKRSFESASHNDPEVITAVANAVDMLADIELTRQLIKERFSENKPD